MSFFTKIALEYMLKDKKTFDEITDLCSKHSKMCSSHKDLFCKKSLQVSGYKVPHNTDPCIILKELLSLAKSIERPSKTNIILADRGLINSVDMYGSPALREFFIKNGYTVKLKINTNNRTVVISPVKSITTTIKGNK
jgi:hypothetical protein